MSLAVDWIWTKKGEEPMRYLDDVYRYAFARLGNREDAEDVAIEVVQALASPCRKRDLKVYMIGMSKRKIVDKLRRIRPIGQLEGREIAPRFDDQSNDAALIQNAMERVSPEHREALILKYVVGLTSAEMGLALGKRSDAVDSQLQRAREAFGEAWEVLTSEEVNRERKRS